MGKKEIYQHLYKHIKNHYGVSGLMGNLQAESALRSTNLENTYERKLNMSDAEYVNSVDIGAYQRFAEDRAGFGLAQWTYPSRKASLLHFAKSKGKSIADEEMQCDFLVLELKMHYIEVYQALCNAISVKDASDVVLTKFEMPRDQSESVKSERAKMGTAIYNEFAPKEDNGAKYIFSYVVQSGDTLSQIAYRYGTTVQAIADYNRIENVNKIYVGQTLKIPVSANSTQIAGFITYIVSKGDTLSKIAKMNNTTVKQLIRWNNISDPNKIYVGQLLIVGLDE